MNIKELYESFKNCECGREHKCPTDDVVIGKGALDSLPALCRDYKSILLVSDKNTNKFAGEVMARIGDKVEKSLILADNGAVVIPNEEKIEEIEKSATKETDLIIGVGSGVINDLCKHVSFKLGLPYYIVATAPSMDGYVSVGSALILSGMKVTINARPPKAIIADTDILKNAPIEMIKAGYGDIIGKFSCLNDWKLSACVNGEYFCQKVYDLTYNCVEKIKDKAGDILNRDENSINLLMEALVIAGVAMSYVNNSRPASGSEHHLSHFFEITGILEGTDYFPHGIDVICSSYYTQKVREELLSIESPERNEKISREKYEKEIKRIYHSLDKEIIALQDKMGWYNLDKYDIYREKWAEIKEILKEAPSSSEMASYIEKIGLDLNGFESFYTKKKIEDALWFAKDLKDRYTVLWLYFELLYK